MILAHLVGEQTLPNLLAALAVAPTRLLHVRSADKKFEAPIRNLERALAEPKLATRTLALSSDPTPEEVTAALANLPADWRPSLVNVTGGTKLMSIGAKVWADTHSVPSLYVDTHAQRFVSTGSVPLPALPALPAVAHALTLERVLTAHGVPADKLRAEPPPPAARAFGAAAAVAWRNDQACSTWLQSLCDQWLLPNRSPHPEAHRTGVAVTPTSETLALAAVQANWATIDARGCFLPRLPLAISGDQLRRDRFVAKLLQNLEGGWFELQLADQMMATGHFHDVRWSVESPDRPDLALGENDVVALDRRSLSPVFVSCKSSSRFPKPLEHIFSLRQRATHFGGTYAQAVLCIARLRFADQEKRLRDFCRVAQVRLLLGSAEIQNWLQP
ncbi:MAG: hypothetical protein RL077_4638 [Verrucomicrobiota bacterium]|jgi:hypothetical protein